MNLKKKIFSVNINIVWDHVTFRYMKDEDSVKIHMFEDVRLNLQKNL